MAKQTFVTTTKGGAWTTLVSGECTVASLVANSTISTTLVSLRVTLAGGATSYILPLNTLQLNVPARLAIGGISLKAGDKVEAMSNTDVDWVATVVTGVAYSSRVVTSPSTQAWTNLVTGPAVVRAMFVSSAGGGSVGIQIKKASTTASIVLAEDLEIGGNKRIMVPIVLAAGESIQVRGTETSYWIATGVQ